jgi:putative phosphoribosyl transferase
VPVASREAVAALSTDVDELVCLAQPALFRAVGEHYADFDQVSDDEVVRLMRMDAADRR